MTGADEDPGMIMRAAADLFRRSKARHEFKSQFECTYVEVYNEKVFDLLEKPKAALRGSPRRPMSNMNDARTPRRVG